MERHHNQHAIAGALVDKFLVEGLAMHEQHWLDRHLQGCEGCTQDARDIRQGIQAARGDSVTAGASLVLSTQLRVRDRAAQLRRQEDRMRPVWITISMALCWAVFSSPLLWEGFRWLGELGHLPAMVWQSGFLVALLMPAAAICALALRTQRLGAERG